MDGEVRQTGVATFERLDGERTTVRLAMRFEPEGVAEKAADAMAVVDRRVRGTCGASRPSSRTRTAPAEAGADGTLPAEPARWAPHPRVTGSGLGKR